VRRLQAQRVLNCYCYTGGFTVAALAGGATEVTSIDSSAPALERARANVALNGSMRRAPSSWMRTSTPACGASSRPAASSTPSCSIRPSWRPRGARERAARAYKDINRLG
jgi:23S rRNA (cytosine1962-C5)-methyltransferase